jgi:DNA-binding beta-propeller fold protein YncE
VMDTETGQFKRFWGAYGNKPDDTNAGRYNPQAPPAQQFRNPVHCADLSVDGLVYVCDRVNDRLQVFQKDGKFVKEQIIAKDTGSVSAAVGQIVLVSGGSVWDIAFSNDPAQRFMYVADGANKKIRILNRSTLAEVGSIGGGGRWPGRFLTPSTVAVDSRGNLYTGEAYHTKRVQKFVR